MASEFETVSERILGQYLAYNPGVGRSLGLHEYDGLVADMSREQLRERVTWAERELTSLQSLNQAGLSEQQRFDLALLEHNLAAVPFQINDLREWETNPLFYSMQLNLVNYLSRNYAPIEERLMAVTRHNAQIPDLLATARQNLQAPFARPVLEVALQVFGGEVRYRQGDLLRAIQSAEFSVEDRNAALAANAAATGALVDFVEYLKAELAQSHNEFAIGREMYAKMLWHSDMVDAPVEEVLAAGERDLQRNYVAFEQTAREIDPDALPEEVRERLKKQHPTADALIGYTSQLLEEIRAFLVERDLIDIPSEIRPIVAPTPPQFRWSFASMATPGPFEKATEAYYYITPPEPDWTPEKQEEWLSAYSYTTLEDISIHEVYPGHYIHFLHFQSAPSRVTKIMRGSTAHSEGWAHYCEQMMFEEGYAANKPPADRAATRLAILDAALKRNCRYVAAVKMHTQGMTLDEATKLFMKYAHMAELPARQEALRGTWQPGYLAYNLGKLMLLKLRDDLKKRDGANFNLKAFHNACVDNGVPPVPLLRRRLLGAADDGKLF
jgi:uncharacterized protein (DUF885 family)